MTAALFTCGSIFESSFAHLYSGRVKRNVAVLRRRHQHNVLEELEPYKDMKDESKGDSTE